MRKNGYDTWNWNYETHLKATGLFFLNFYIKCLPLIFFIAILVTMGLLSTLCSVTVKLQHQSQDIISAYEQISDVQNEFELLKINIDEKFYTLFKEVVELLLVKMSTLTGRSSF